jgi:putative nucleotidyltransferase with HDIG domain
VSPLIENLDNMVRDVPSMPVVAQKVMHMLGDPRTTNPALGETLGADQSLASRILQMANSPFFGTRQKIGSISGAILILGHAALRSLIITACTKGLYKNPGLMEQKLWEHALATATASRLIASTAKGSMDPDGASTPGSTDPDEAFVAGLLHDIGQTIFALVYHNAYETLFMRVYNEGLSRNDLMEMEREEFGYNHCEVGLRVITKWRLPGNIARVARRHHTENPETLENEDHPRIVALVAEANLIVCRLGLGLREPDKRVDIISTLYNKMLNLERPQVLRLVEETLKTYHEARDQFNLEN